MVSFQVERQERQKTDDQQKNNQGDGIQTEVEVNLLSCEVDGEELLDYDNDLSMEEEIVDVRLTEKVSTRNFAR